ncbi:O-antigen ligase family protein [Streptomyces aidingensis]|uniref:O-antigen ligase n=1 Tax=Streptomyces aidingensis TaxID=910347 RepID=A0A1I1QN47_9ACTN|nr:O-antigen ligase family protein [Streptomyces aidingensis]SFD23437.1 O-antigen ligase [Streptomyces aidingensis]
MRTRTACRAALRAAGHRALDRLPVPGLMLLLAVWWWAPRAGTAVARWWPVTPAVATVLLLALPDGGALPRAGGGGEGIGGEAPRVVAADVASLLLVAVCAGALLIGGARGARASSEGHRPGPGRWRPGLPLAAVAVFAAPLPGLTVATMASADPAAGLTGCIRFLQVFVLVPLALTLLLRGRREARAVALALVALAAAQGAVGAVQYLTGTGASYSGENIRAVGTFGPLHVMGMSTVVAAGLLAALCLGLAAGGRAARWRRPVWLGCAAALAVPLAMSFSRGAWIATALAAVTVTALAGLRPRRRTVVALVCGGVLLASGVGAVAGDRLADRLTSIGQVTGGTPDQSVTDRYAMWSAALSMWRAEPWTGVGPRQYPAFRDTHASVALSSGSDTAGAGREFRREPLLSPHNMYLLVLSEQGLAGAAGLLGGWAVLLAGCLARLRAARRAEGGRAPAAGLIATGLLIWQLVGFCYGDIGGPTTVLTAVCFGLAAWWAFSPAALPGGRARAVPAPAAGTEGAAGRAAGSGNGAGAGERVPGGRGRAGAGAGAGAEDAPPPRAAAPGARPGTPATSPASTGFLS